MSSERNFSYFLLTQINALTFDLIWSLTSSVQYVNDERWKITGINLFIWSNYQATAKQLSALKILQIQATLRTEAWPYLLIREKCYLIVLFILVKIVLMCMSKDSFESKGRSRCFWESALLAGILSKNILGWIFLVVFLLKMTSWACFVGTSFSQGDMPLLSRTHFAQVSY